jgi:hypothetical protein
LKSIKMPAPNRFTALKRTTQILDVVMARRLLPVATLLLPLLAWLGAARSDS